MRQVIVDQIEALAELNRIVARHGRNLDAVEPVRRTREEPRSLSSAAAMTLRPAAMRLRAMKPLRATKGHLAAKLLRAVKRRRVPRNAQIKRFSAAPERGYALPHPCSSGGRPRLVDRSAQSRFTR